MGLIRQTGQRGPAKPGTHGHESGQGCRILPYKMSQRAVSTFELTGMQAKVSGSGGNKEDFGSDAKG